MYKIFTLFAGALLLLGASVQAQELSITELGRYTDGRVEALEIVTYDSASARIFITNAASDSIDIVDVSDPSQPMLIGHIDVLSYGGGVNSVVSLGNGHIAAAIEANVKQNPGKIVFYDVNGAYVHDVMVGALPDMVTVSPDGRKVVCANEGEPADDYLTDPEGSVSIIDISAGIQNATVTNVSLAGLALSNPSGALIKPNTPLENDLEPEYIAIDANSAVAFVACQENNVLMGIDLATGAINLAVGLGFKDHSLPGNGFDASNRDNGINIQNWPVKGIYQPDAIATYYVGTAAYIVTANEGDARDYGGYSSEERIKDLTLDPTAFPNAADLQSDDSLGRLNSFTPDMIGDTDGDGDIDELYSYGARSFSIFDASGNLVYDSGDDFEQYIAANYPSFFNCNDGLASEQDARSDDKGPEPEALTIGQIGSRTYAFIGLERQGGIMVYNITDPQNVTFVTFVNSYDVTNGTMTDIAPEGLVFVPAHKSHTGSHLLIASHEVSGTTTLFEIADLTPTTSLKAKENFKIFPNPSAEALIQLEVPMNVSVFNALGQPVGRYENAQTINTASWAAGTYYFLSDEGATQCFIKL